MDEALGYLPVAGGRLYYEVAGRGAPVVLVHGNWGDTRHWDAQFSYLAEHYRVVRYDVRGFGRSTMPVEGERYEDHSDLAAVLDHLDIGAAHVVGWSMGSAIAVDFVIGHPQRATSLTAVGPWVFGHSSQELVAVMTEFGQIAMAAGQGGVDAACDALMAAPFFADAICDPKVGARFERIAREHSWWAFTHPSPQAFLHPSAHERLGEIRVPVLAITAEHDSAVCREFTQLLAEQIPYAETIDMPGTGHLMHMEQPAQFNQLLDRFFEGQVPECGAKVSS